MPLYSFRCPQGHEREHLVREYLPDATICECGEVALRQLSLGAARLGLAETPRDEKRINLSLFREATEEREYAYGKVERETGISIPGVNLWKQAKRQAKEVLAGKRPAPKI